MTEDQARISIQDDREKRWLWMDNRMAEIVIGNVRLSGTIEPT